MPTHTAPVICACLRSLGSPEVSRATQCQGDDWRHADTNRAGQTEALHIIPLSPCLHCSQGRGQNHTQRGSGLHMRTGQSSCFMCIASWAEGWLVRTGPCQGGGRLHMRRTYLVGLRVTPYVEISAGWTLCLHMQTQAPTRKPPSPTMTPARFTAVALHMHLSPAKLISAHLPQECSRLLP